MKIRYHEAADQDLRHILDFYESESPRLVGKFLAELESIEENIRRNPNHYHFSCDPSYRRANFRKFNHHLLYRFYPETQLVRILVIRHDHQHPNFGLDRF